jgi:release factor glutamine methyltransferase
VTLSLFEKEILMCHALKIPRAQLLIHPELYDENNPDYRLMEARRLKHEPLAYITGHQPFFGIRILVDRNVLIPRPETEELIEHALKLMKKRDGLVYDIGTGSGAIAVCIAKHLPDISMIGTDTSPEAVEIAKKNAVMHQVEKRCSFIVTDLFEGLTEEAEMIVSNPPYIPTGDIPGLMPDVKDWEPVSALDGGADGLDHIRRIIDYAPDYLTEDGLLVMEFGYGQVEKVKLEANRNFAEVEILKDLSGIDRFLVAGGWTGSE